MICIEVGSSIPYLDFHSEHSSLCIGPINEPGCTRRKEFSFYTAISARYLNILLFWIDGCLLRKEFTYSKFQQIINSTTHQYSEWAVVRILK
jgi:hypothetical protein